jgi:hypothetical protein
VTSCQLVILYMALYPRNKSQWWNRFSRTVRCDTCNTP